MKGGENVNIGPIVSMLASVPSPTALKQETLLSSGFAALFATMKQGKQLQAATVNDSPVLPLLPFNVSDLYQDLQKLFDSIPIDEGYVQQDTLNDRVVQQLFQLLPTSLKEQVTEAFAPGRPVEQIVEDEKELENAETLLAVALVLFQFEQKQIPLPPDMIQTVQRRLSSVFSITTNDFLGDTNAFLGDTNAFLGNTNNEVMNMRALLETVSRSLQMKGEKGEKGEKEKVQRLSAEEFSKFRVTLLNSDKPASFFDGYIRSMEQRQRTPLNGEQLIHQERGIMFVPLEEANDLTPSRSLSNDLEKMTSMLTDNKTPNEHTILLQPKETKSDVQRSFIHQLTEIMKTSKFTKANNGQSQLVIRLHPEHLGTLTIKLVAQKDGELAAKIITNTTAVKELIEANIHQIRHMIPTENIVVERFDVWTQNELDGMNRNQGQQQPKQPFENEQGQAEESEPASEEFADALKEQLNTTV